MEMNQIAKNALQLFVNYCKEKKYQVKESVINREDIRLDISNNRERTIVLIYRTGKIVMGGQKNNLKQEFEGMKTKFEQAPGEPSLEEKSKACIVTYDIMLAELRNNIKTMLGIPGATSELTEMPTQAIEWRIKFSRSSKSVTLTQFRNGTLSIQGRQNDLLDEICDAVEKKANPSEKDIVARFVAGDEEVLKKCTPEIIQVAEKNIKVDLGPAYDFLDPHDQKWFIAAECLRIAQVPLPEFSPIVMPASKAFEGFVKKLLVAIGLFDPGYFSTEKTNFSLLNDDKSQNSRRVSVCLKDKHINTLLKSMYSRIQTHRHFLMHSDESVITKIDTHKEAEQKIKDILRDVKTFFDSFNKVFNFA